MKRAETGVGCHGGGCGARLAIVTDEKKPEGGLPGLVVRYVNAIAEGVCRKHRETLIDTFAYRYCERPPHKTRLHPNVRVQIAPGGACQGHP